MLVLTGYGNLVSVTPIHGSDYTMTSPHLGLPPRPPPPWPACPHSPISPDPLRPHSSRAPRPTTSTCQGREIRPTGAMGFSAIQAELKPRVERFLPGGPQPQADRSPGSAPSQQTNTATSCEARPTSDAFR